MTDEALIDLLFARSEQAIPALQDQYGPYCTAIASRLLTDPRDVEECISDCWLAAWNAIPPTRPAYFKGWLGSVVRHRAIAMGKANGKRPPTVDESALELAACLPCSGDAHTKAEAAELGRAVSRFLEEQRPDRRAAFLRRYWYAEPVDQVAAHMGWSVSKTKSVLFRVRNELRHYLCREGLL